MRSFTLSYIKAAGQLKVISQQVQPLCLLIPAFFVRKDKTPSLGGAAGDFISLLV
jgi:hypothetical protein